jgi:uncharacterized protein
VTNLARRLVRSIVRSKRQICIVAIAIFVALNLLAYLGAYAMTHIRPPGESGLGISRPQNTRLPIDLGLIYTTDRLPIGSNEWLETWSIPARTPTPKGTVLLFPGNLATKSQQPLAIAQILHQFDYDCVLVDFRGVGGSSGNTTTLGANEARDVVVAMQSVRQMHPQRPLILHGVSMGSAAILNAIANHHITPDAIILELPYARLIDAVRSRVKYRHIPTFPISELLVFWGGFQHGFNSFAHNPVDYARQVKCPTLILSGDRDRWTNSVEIDEIFRNLQGRKQSISFDRAGHELLLSKDRHLWETNVRRFLNTIATAKVIRTS